MSVKRPEAPTSATEIALFRRCPRAWAANYASDAWPVSRDQKVFAAGNAYHKLVEAYLRRGEMPRDPADPITEMFMCALPYLPAPFTCAAVEELVTVQIGSVPATVTADAVTFKDGLPAIKDHKTSKDPQRYGLLKREQKLDDTQTVLYCCTYLPGHAGVWFDHIYVQKHKAVAALYDKKDIRGYAATPKAISTDMLLTEGELRPAFERVVREPAEKLFQIRRKGLPIDPMSLPAASDVSECNAYGGCPHKDRCYPHGTAFIPTTYTPPAPSTEPTPTAATPAAPPRALTLLEFLASRGK